MSAIKKQVHYRLKRIEGQIRGLQKMVDQDTYCIDVITQTSAIKKALAGVEDVLLESHLWSCIRNQLKSGKHEKATKEILQVYALKRT
jgi:CsoR family transcriptional regulator, copper-sensing transcriptional repressor